MRNVSRRTARCLYALWRICVSTYSHYYAYAFTPKCTSPPAQPPPHLLLLRLPLPPAPRRRLFFATSSSRANNEACRFTLTLHCTHDTAHTQTHARERDARAALQQQQVSVVSVVSAKTERAPMWSRKVIGMDCVRRVRSARCDAVTCARRGTPMCVAMCYHRQPPPLSIQKSALCAIRCVSVSVLCHSVIRTRNALAQLTTL